ncbi:hypothetical protein IL306_007961 [Fusarium sp. DS 682]|nr:hypothetical protein IL306_007961 [Fusarium sp. DS 682]
MAGTREPEPTPPPSSPHQPVARLLDIVRVDNKLGEVTSAFNRALELRPQQGAWMTVRSLRQQITEAAPFPSDMLDVRPSVACVKVAICCGGSIYLIICQEATLSSHAQIENGVYRVKLFAHSNTFDSFPINSVDVIYALGSFRWRAN